MKLLFVTLFTLAISTYGFSNSLELQQNTKNEDKPLDLNEVVGASINCKNNGSCKFNLCLKMSSLTRARKVFLLEGGYHTERYYWTMKECSEWSENFPIATEQDIRLINLEIENIVKNIRKKDDKNILDAQDVVSNNPKVLESFISNISESEISDEGEQ